MTCNKVRGYTAASRHAHVKRVFKNVLRQYGFLPDEAEPRFFGGGAGPDVCFLVGDTLTLVDLVITNPLAATYVADEQSVPGATLRRAEQEKDRRHTSHSAERNMVFYPLALTTFGTLGPRSKKLLALCARHTPDPRGFKSHMTMALSVAIQIGNARMLMAAVDRWSDFGVR